MRRAHAIAATTGLAALLLAGCASRPPEHGGGQHHGRGGYYQNDGPPDNTDIDLSRVPDAVPRNAPRSRYGNPDSYTALGKTYYVLKSAAGFTQTGMASWYGRQFAGRRTASGEPYNMFRMTAAHKRLPIPSWVEVTNLDNGKHVIVRINDRGPFHKGRIIDLSYVAARRLGIVARGSAPVRIRTVTPETMHASSASQGSRSSASRQTQSSGAGGSHQLASSSTHAARTSPATRAGAGSSPGKAGLYLQTGAFGESANARRQRRRLEADGVAPVVVLAPTADTPLYRVRIGPFSDRASRDAVRQTLQTHGFPVRLVER